MKARNGGGSASGAKAPAGVPIMDLPFDFTSYAIAISTDGTELYIGDQTNRKIHKVKASNGQTIAMWGSGTSNLLGVAVQLDGSRVLVSDTGGHRVCAFDGAQGGLVLSFGVQQEQPLNERLLHRFLYSYGAGKGSGPGQFIFPCGVAVDGNRGLVAVVDSGNARVSVFTTTGDFVRSFGRKDGEAKAGFAAGEVVWNWKFVSADLDSGDRIVVSDRATQRVQVFTWQGEWLGGIGPGLPVCGPLLSDTRVACGKDGQVFVVCQDSAKKTHVMCFHL